MALTSLVTNFPGIMDPEMVTERVGG